MEHMEENNLFTKHQHGFRKGYSYVTLLIDVCDKWSEELDNKNCIDIVYLDFQKAFDSVPHQRLLTKLKGYGFKRKLLTWVENFLKKQKTKGTSRWFIIRLGGRYQRYTPGQRVRANTFLNIH